VNDIISSDIDDGLEQLINLGEDKPSSQISFQLAQDFYNEITGRSENIQDYSRDSFILKLHHVEQLHHLLEQSLEQYNIQSFNENYSVNYVDDSSERFSSLAKLKLLVSSRGAAIEDISIQYNILIVLPKTKRAQEYKIHIKLLSRVAKMEKMRDEINDIPIEIPLFQFEKHKIAVFSIDYIDISVANALMSVIKRWFNSIEKKQLNSTIKKVRKLSHFLPIFCKYGLLSLCAYLTFLASKTYVTNESDLNAAVVFLLCASLSLFVSYRFGKLLGHKAEINLDSIYEQSYISFSGADENLVAESTIKIVSSRNKFIASIFGTLIIGACGSLIASGLISIW
jgi:hypothetical protein